MNGKLQVSKMDFQNFTVIARLLGRAVGIKSFSPTKRLLAGNIDVLLSSTFNRYMCAQWLLEAPAPSSSFFDMYELDSVYE